MAWQILEGDCIDVMRTLPAESVDAIFTSPPYAMQRKATYGGVPEAEYPAWTVAWMREARRLLKPDGSVIINISPHVKGGQLSDYTLRTRLALREDGWCEVDELIWHKTDAMPTGARKKPRRSWESLHWFAKHGQPWSDPLKEGRPPVRTDQRMTSRATRNGWAHADSGRDGRPYTTPPISRVTNLVSLATAKASDVDHPAMFPIRLAEWVGKLICPPSGTMLDPFSGSASTGVAAIRNGWDYIGIEAMSEYAEMSRRRLAHTEAA